VTVCGGERPNPLNQRIASLDQLPRGLQDFLRLPQASQSIVVEIVRDEQTPLGGTQQFKYLNHIRTGLPHDSF